MAFKGIKKTENTAAVNHFEEAAKIASANTTPGTMGRPVVDAYRKQDKRVQFYISQEMIDVLLPVAIPNGCKDVTAYAKKLLLDEFDRVKNAK